MFVSDNNYCDKWTKEPGLKDTDALDTLQVEPILVSDHEFALISNKSGLYKYNTTTQEWNEWSFPEIKTLQTFMYCTRIRPSQISFDAKQKCVYIAPEGQTNEIIRITMHPIAKIPTHILLPPITNGSITNDSYFIEFMFNIESILHIFCTNAGRINHFIHTSDTNTIIKVSSNPELCTMGCKFLYLKSTQTVVTIHEHKHKMYAYNLQTFEWTTYMQLPKMCLLTYGLSTDERFVIIFTYGHGTDFILNLNTKELFAFHINLPIFSKIKHDLQQKEKDGCPVHNNGKHIIYRVMCHEQGFVHMKMICCKCNNAQLSTIKFVSSRIKLYTIITQNVKRGNLLSDGYVRNLWKCISFKKMLFPPTYLINIISSYCDSQCDVHLLESNGTHWKIALDEILTIKKKFGTLIESVH
eukprot:444808_1